MSPKASVRLATFHIPGHPLVSCGLYRLQPGRQPLLAMIRMWAAQVGKTDLSEEEADAFRSSRQVVEAADGNAWSILDFSSLATGGANGPDIVAAIAEYNDARYVLKLLGPAGDVQELKPALERLVASFR